MDIIERLRFVGGIEGTTRWYINPDGPEAADEIERLREELEDMHRRERSTAVQNLGNEGQLCDEIERLRDALATVATSEISTIEEIKLFARAALKEDE